VRADRQSELVLGLIDTLRADGDTGAGVFLIGHSMDAVLALHMAAAARAGAIAAVDISGLPFVFDEALADKNQLASLDFLPDNSQVFRRALFYGPDGTFGAGAKDWRAAAPCSPHRNESSSPGPSLRAPRTPRALPGAPRRC
jgi:pimeloyl-ACP methyl ester carboxylesterase